MAHYSNHKQKVMNLLAGFFRTSRTKNALQILAQKNMTGWERWWQHELAMYLSQCPQVAASETEHRVPVANKARAKRNHVSLDVALRFKAYAPNRWFSLELKQHEDFRVCLRRIKVDMEKFITSDRKHLRGLAGMMFVGVVPWLEWVFRTNVTGRFGNVTEHFGNVTGDSGRT